MSKKIKIGPGVFITSGFMGPGMITMCLLAGVSTGVSLLWAVLISTLVTIVIQDMCIRLGFYTKQGLEDTLGKSHLSKGVKMLSSVYILGAVFIGSSAYQSGNLAGAKFGLQLLGLPFDEAVLLSFIAIVCIVLILIGNHEWIKRVLALLIIFMFCSFLLLGIKYLPHTALLLKSIFIPVLKTNDLALAIGLIGITIVPFNLFLHSNLIVDSKDEISTLRKNSAFYILIGGIIAGAIVIVGSSAQASGVNNFREMALVLEHKEGLYNKYVLALGLFSSGLASSIVAPFVVALVTNGILKQSKSLSTIITKSIQIAIVLIGYLVAITKINNREIIKVAQAMNGVLLPIVTIYLLIVLNDRNLMKVHKNSLKHNVLGICVMIIFLLLAAKSILNLF
jgi:manganese transport protein